MGSNDNDIVKRMVLPDRIQVSVTPVIMSVYDYDCYSKRLILKSKYKGYKDVLIANCKLNDYDSDRYRDSKNKFHYMINIPSDYEFISSIRLDAIDPFTFSFKFNFLRFLREFFVFNVDYDKQVLLDENNYIPVMVLDDKIVSRIYDLLSDLNNILIGYVNKIMFKFFPVFDIQYNRVTVNQIEFNVDYYVGTNESLYFMNRFSDFINSDYGIAFRNRVGAIALKHKIPFNLSSENTVVEKNESISIQFEICKGLKAKVYRKTRDHIRFEFTFEKSYLRRKFRNINVEKPSTSTNVKRIVNPVMEFSKELFRGIEFEKYLNDIKKSENYNLVFNQLNPVYEFYRQTDPVHNDIIDSIVNSNPITDSDSISYISKRNSYSKKFERKYTDSGVKQLILKKCYIPVLQHKSRLPREIVWKGDKMVVKKWSYA